MSLLVLLLALQQTPAPAPTTGAATPAPRPQATSATLEVRITDRSGVPITNATVTAEGASARSGKTDGQGVVTFRTVAPGAYRFRAEAEQFIVLEKELAVRGGRSSVELALSRAPEKAVEPPPVAPPPPPAPAPAPAMNRGFPGEPRVISITDLAERSLGGRDPVKTVPVACSGTDNVKLVVLRESLPQMTHTDESETLYVVAGQAQLTIRDRGQSLMPGWVGIIPRGVPYSVKKEGKNPAVILSIAGGQPCEGPSTGSQH